MGKMHTHVFQAYKKIEHKQHFILIISFCYMLYIKKLFFYYYHPHDKYTC